MLMPFDDDAPTPGLDEFLAAFNRDDNEWWRLGSGHQLNVFEECLDRLEKQHAKMLELSGDLERMQARLTLREERNQRLIEEVVHLKSTMTERRTDEQGHSDDDIPDNGWGATFHRHFGSNEIHRDGGGECQQQGTPRPVYVFDPDVLHEHESYVRTEAAAKAVEAFAETLGVNVGDEDDDYWRGYRNGQRQALRSAVETAAQIRQKPGSIIDLQAKGK